MIIEIDVCAWFLRLLFLSIAIWIFKKIRALFKVAPKGKSVLITGCDSGFGLMTAERLSGKGFKVFAGCLTDKGVEHFEGKNNIFAFKMDVTNEESVSDAFEVVKKELGPNNGLWGLINNAGVLRHGELEVMSISNWKLQMNVNVIGIAITTKQFFPLLLKGKGRIVNIASVAGRFATPGTSGYNASKYAVEGLTDSWRRELKLWGVDVILIEPGIMKTPLWDAPFNEAAIDVVWNTLNDDQQARYGREYFIEGEKTARQIIASFGGDPKLVVDVLDHSISAKFPNTRYAVGLDSIVWISLSYLPTRISDALLPFVMKPVLPACMKKK